MYMDLISSIDDFEWSLILVLFLFFFFPGSVN